MRTHISLVIKLCCSNGIERRHLNKNMCFKATSLKSSLTTYLVNWICANCCIVVFLFRSFRGLTENYLHILLWFTKNQSIKLISNAALFLIWQLIDDTMKFIFLFDHVIFIFKAFLNFQNLYLWKIKILTKKQYFAFKMIACI